MFASLLTTVFFSLSAIFATRSIKTVGATTANLGRLSLAFLFLGTYAHTLGVGLSGAGRDWFLLSGVIGMGLGDLALFAALPRLGSRLTVLMCQCIAVPVAMRAVDAGFDVVGRPAEDLNDWLATADVLLTDYSSAIFEWALLRRPLILLVNDLEAYEQDPGLYLDYRTDIVGTQVRDTDAVASAILEGAVDGAAWDEFIAAA